MERWNGKIAVVTGASAGLGAAICRKLVEEGINVVGFARRKELIDQLAEDIEGKNGAKLCGLKVDITNEDEIVKAFEYIAKNIGPVSILINNAGVAQLTTLIDGDTTKWKKVLDTNVLGLCIATREAVKMMRENNIDGHIVHMNSIAGHKVVPIPYTNVYSASKFAVTSLARTLSNELKALGSKIKVTSISPGYVETDIAKANGFLEDETMREIESKAPRMYPIDIANAVLYVLGTPPHVEVTELTVQPVGEIA
ncbi:farnesol dehydrogenase-like [Coccinella septempunctata]|uniref:farnesol dehydrogenase-like n=1 Tax=Coccinella septempunctata TaxID=41139 RepID=UPI001D08BDCB|nr:farnesol dehydrogenase-like [Coccinella septempunctata]